jgi:hypothetical protein
MPKRTKYPRLRRHSWTTAQGERKTAYYFDMRPEGKRDIPLGTDHATALAKWHELTFGIKAKAGLLAEGFDEWEREALPKYKPVTKRDYTLALTQLRPAFDGAAWADVTLPVLRAYLDKRTAKRRGNLEMSVLSVVWRWCQVRGITTLPWPAAGMERSRWKNKETPRTFEVTDDLFAAVYEHADQVVRDCMDISSATGLRLTDCRTIPMPSDGVIRGRASKTGKALLVVVSDSPVLSALLERRKGYRGAHTMLLSTPTGRPVTYRMLDGRWTKAREAAAQAHPKLADQIRAMYLRDMRSRAADLAETLEDAAELLQHGSKTTTQAHYRTRVAKLKTVR